ncbi:hypothetical protein BH24PSE2_BH24PSE2_15130 [soil metagenome]
MSCRRFYVSGRVQGVFFRASTAERARALGVTGWARNLPDGRVEVLACGPEDTVQALADWLRQGPRNARVEKVEAEPIREVEAPPDFKTD